MHELCICYALALHLHTACIGKKPPFRAAFYTHVLLLLGGSFLRVLNDELPLVDNLRGKHEGLFNRIFLDVVNELLHEIGLVVHVVYSIDDDVVVAALIPRKAVQDNRKQL